MEFRTHWMNLQSRAAIACMGASRTAFCVATASWSTVHCVTKSSSRSSRPSGRESATNSVADWRFTTEGSLTGQRPRLGWESFRDSRTGSRPPGVCRVASLNRAERSELELEALVGCDEAETSVEAVCVGAGLVGGELDQDATAAPRLIDGPPEHGGSQDPGFAEKKGHGGMDSYRAKKSAASIDGLPGL